MKKIDSPALLAQEDLRTPLYHQIYLIFHNKILNGECPDGSMLPTENQIAATFGVSRITVTRALKELESAGLVSRGRGRGTRVQYAGGTRVRGSVESLVDSLHANARNSAAVIDFGYMPAPEEVASSLNLGRAAIVQQAVRTFSRSGLPFSLLTTYVPEEIGRAWQREDLAHKALVTLLSDAGVKLTRALQTVSATLADNEVALMLKVSVGSPLLRIVRISYDEKDRPVEYLLGLYPPDRYQFSMSLSKDTNASWVSEQRPEN
jgi:GntR family transcriptional regulator